MVNMLGYKQYTSILNQEHPDSDNDLCFPTQLKMKLEMVMKHGEEGETGIAAQFLRDAT